MVIIGIDGGATKISGWKVKYDENTGLFSLGEENVQKKYSDYDSFISGFKPLDLKIQLGEMNSGINLTGDEKKQGSAYINAAADVITEFSKLNQGEKLLIGFGMPGLKTIDKRGISVLMNGPRMPHFLADIEDIVMRRGVKLYSSIGYLGSDADYCGIGEEYSFDGKFKDVQNAYYLGGGTGVADAMKLGGKLLTFDSAREWIAKSWEFKTVSGLSMERYSSASGIQYIYSRYSGIEVEELNKNNIYPPQILHAATDGDSAALNTINDISVNIANLFFERIVTIYSGWKSTFEFVNPNRDPLVEKHPYSGMFLEEIIVGQRLGDLLEESKGTDLLWNQIVDELTLLFSEVKDEKLKNYYLKGGEFDPEIIKISKLREAPALGAGIDAYLNLKSK
jgi:hypothetical protein